MYDLREYDTGYYCTGMNIDAGGRIQWTTGMGVESLVVAAPYSTQANLNPEGFCRQLCNQLNNRNPVISHSEYTHIGNDIFVKRVNVMDKARENGTGIYIPGRLYLVLAVREENGVTCIYKPRKNDFSIVRGCPFRISCSVTQGSHVIHSGGFFGRKTEIQYYKITLQPMFGQGYEDGLLVYRIGNDRIPITQQMLDHGMIYINSYNGSLQCPVVEPTSEKIEICRR